MIRLRVLGSIELENSDGRELTPLLAQPKRLALLVYLASTPRTFHRRDTLLALLWPDVDTARARTALNQAIRFLRRELGESSESIIVSRGADEVGIDRAKLWCDAADFRDHIDAGRTAAALELYRGDFLAGFFAERSAGFEAWAERERAWFRANAARAARALAGDSEHDENFTTAVSTARRAVELSDGDERVVRELLELLDRLGDRSGAIHAYEAFARRLSDELEAQPSAETVAVIERIRARGIDTSAAAPVLGPTVAGTWTAGSRTFGEPGSELNGWRIERPLALGGMSSVYLARDIKHERFVALKTLRPESVLFGDGERFLREIQITARLAHPHILPLIDSGASNGVLYLVTPYVAGESLRTRLRREPRLPPLEALRIATEVTEALDYAHRCGIIHRDIKPENILLADGHAVVADFGVARTLASSAPGMAITDSDPRAVVGSRRYMSPEQAAANADVGPRADLYSLGCLLFEMLTGEPPPAGGSNHVTMRGRTDIPPSVARLISRCMAQDPDRRPTSAADVLHTLVAASASDNTARSVDGGVKSLRLRKQLAVAIGLVAVVTLTILSATRLAAPRTVAVAGSVAVVPFRITTTDSAAFAWLSDGIVELLTVRLTGDGRLRFADPGIVLGEWHRNVPGERRSGRDASMRRVSAAANAERIIEGSVTGTSRDVVLTAWILSMPEARITARASVSGSPDSLPSLVDRLAAQLLGVAAGLEETRLATLTSASLPAIRSYLAGRASLRAGRMDAALLQFRAAVAFDSTFALAGLELARTSLQTPSNDEDFSRGKAIALANEQRLSRVDRLLLHVTALEWSSAEELFTKAVAAVRDYPDRPEFWYGLGEAYLHTGPLAGVDSSFERAAYAFRSGWELDSAAHGLSALSSSTQLVAEPVRHMVELANLRGDTAAVRRWAARVLAVDSLSELADLVRWHRAVLDGDSARKTFWNGGGDQGRQGLARIYLFIVWTGIGVEDYPRVVAEVARPRRAFNPGGATYAQMELLLNRGRPSEVVRRTESALRGLHAGIRDQVHNGMYWGGDTVAGRRAMDELARTADPPVTTSGRDAQALYFDVCTVGQWRASRGDMVATNVAIKRLRSATISGLTSDSLAKFGRVVSLCVALLDASRATSLGSADRRTKLALADSLAASSVWQTCCSDPVSGANVLLAQLWERQGDVPRALQAVRRRSARFLRNPNYLSTHVREEGRLAAMAGDTAGAVRAYRHYLGLRYDPEPSLRPEVERVRRELAALIHAR